MSDVVAELQANHEAVAAVRSLRVPKYRQAYSDRTAWIMACAAELAYLRFNSVVPEVMQEQFQDALERLTRGAGNAKFNHLLSTFAYDPDEQKERLREGLATIDLQLDATFDRDGTQAIIASCDEFVVLAFRGTEANSIKDIKADARANSVEAPTEGRIHAGFSDALTAVQYDIEQELDSGRYGQRPLFITGHSLGGAVATIAAKRLSDSREIAACYTFGSPRVGDEDWITWLKTPLYRVVNAADCVTMLPPGAMTISVLAWLAGLIPARGDLVRAWLLRTFGGYIHGGNMRYLTHCNTGQYSKVRLLYSVSLLTRIKGLVIKGLPWRHFLADHSISIYRKKLMVVARARNDVGD